MISTPISFNLDLFTYGFFTIDSIIKLHEKNLITFKQNLSATFIFIFISQICEIFSDLCKMDIQIIFL